MKRFILKIILFLVPVALYYAFPAAVIILSKEYYTTAHVVAVQAADKNTLYGNVYNTGSFIPYKQMLVAAENPRVVALGSSRALEIRKEFFTASTTFINAGLAGRSISDIEYFINTMPGSTTLLLDLDREIFTQNPDQADARAEDYISLLGFHFYMPLNVSRGIYLDYFLRHQYSLSGLISAAGNGEKLGMNAIANGNGFRFDGSYRYNTLSHEANLATTTRGQIDVVAQNISKAAGDSLLAGDDQNIAANLQTLRQVLVLAKSRGITIVGFIPPYPVEINQATFATSSAYRSRDTNLTNGISADFKQAGFSFYDLSDITKYGGTDAEFMDTVHGTDLLYAKLSLYLGRHDPTMSNYFNKNTLTKMIASTTGNFLQF